MNDAGRIETIDPETGKRIKGLCYKGQNYYGADVYIGLEQMSKDIRGYDRNRPLADIHEALSLVMSIYGDLTTNIKPELMAKTAKVVAMNSDPMLAEYATGEQLISAGLAIAAEKQSASIVFSGHNTVSSLGKSGIKPVVSSPGDVPRLIFTDYGMAPKFKGPGAIISYGRDIGIVVTRFKDKDSEEIIEETLFSPENYMRAVQGVGSAALAI
ncbi:hypothetical protein FACS189431_8600 [Alphaproteobacteria bacterium]|nr:hypothetical protein FACS189431_8600 [Alphaproteobacteria bacterium]